MSEPSIAPERLRRRLHQLILGLAACGMVGCAAMVGGPAINDYKIASDPGRALARVTEVSDTRTTVEFQDEEGLYRAPPAGLLYPTGLGAGQRVWVSYAKTDPNLVKVEGRAWTLTVIPALSTAAVVLFVAVLLWLAVNVGVAARDARARKLQELSRERRTHIPPREA